MKARTLLAAAAVLAGLLAAGRPYPSVARQCPRLWSRPETLRTSTGAFVNVDRPVGIIPAGKGFLLLGPQVTLVPKALDSAGPSPELLEFDPAHTLGAIVSPSGMTHLIKRPEFLHRTPTIWAFPAEPAGFHLIWGVPRDSTKPNGSEVSSVWYARFDGQEWSKPELVMKAQRLRWWQSISAVAVTKDRFVVAASAVDSGWTGIVASHRTASGWVTDRFKTRLGLPPSGVAVTISKGRALLFYPDDTTGTGASGLAMYVRELAPTGAGWSAERLLQRLEPGAINWPLALESPDHWVHLFWLFSEGGGEVVEHLSSTDLKTWRMDRFPIQAHAFGFNVGAIGKSSIQIVLQTSRFKGTGSILWTPKGFSPVEELPFAVAIGTGPNLARLSNGRLLMTWTAMGQLEFKKEVVPFPVTLYASRAEKCW